ncbi:MAG: nuclear transport factor 2 family protein [Actinomycetia bacterium]|nr:nuclear transport factor 2 family protein [Actinomycetes bacterium]
MSRDPIAELVHLYADAVVNFDGEQWGATWAPDARWTLIPGRTQEGRDAIVEFWYRAMGTFDAVVQTVLNGTYTLDEEAGAGSGRWHIQESFRRTNGEVGILLAHYDDAYVLIDGRWCFAERSLVVHYAGPPDLSAPFLNAGAWAKNED